MVILHTVIQDGKIIADAPASLTNGTPVKLAVEVDDAEFEKCGMDESEWPTDPEAIEAWIRRHESLEPVDFPAEDDYDRRFRQFNLEAVRKQMETGQF